jgi:hypothetical protein
MMMIIVIHPSIIIHSKYHPIIWLVFRVSKSWLIVDICYIVGSMVHSLGVFLNMYMIRVTLDKGPGPRQIKLSFSLHNINLERKPISPDQFFF